MKSLLMILTVCSLSACSTVELIHEPVDCLGQPKVSLGLTQEEFNGLDKSTIDKIVIFGKTLRARIDFQCELNRFHDLQYME